MFQKFEPQSWVSVQDYDTIRDSDVVEDLKTGERITVANSPFYKSLVGYPAKQVRYLPDVYDVVRKA